METSSYLFMSRRKRLVISSRIMEMPSNSNSNISTDSLEDDCRQKSNEKREISDENVDTILVPFYENDVLMKVPKGQKKNQKKDGKLNDKPKKEFSQPNYLVNKAKGKNTSYLEIFRKQFSTRQQVEKPPDDYEISSLMPEFGDTELESIDDDASNAISEYYKTEAYNETYYEKLLNREISLYLDQSCEEGLRFTEDIRSKSPNETDDNNLRSVSEVTQHRRPMRRGSVLPISNVKLGGLGPDTEKIKPRLERARSLQRYSEKVRMENRLRIYKKSVLNDETRTEQSALPRDIPKDIANEPLGEINASYLVNKTHDQKSTVVRKLYDTKSKSADTQRPKDRTKTKHFRDKSTSNKNDNVQNRKSMQREIEPKSAFHKDEEKVANAKNTIVRLTSSSKSRGINTDINAMASVVPPVHISFLVNVGGMRPSSTLRSMEEKHRMYQEQVKAFTVDNTNL